MYQPPGSATVKPKNPLKETGVDEDGKGRGSGDNDDGTQRIIALDHREPPSVGSDDADVDVDTHGGLGVRDGELRVEAEPRLAGRRRVDGIRSLAGGDGDRGRLGDRGRARADRVMGTAVGEGQEEQPDRHPGLPRRPEAAGRCDDEARGQTALDLQDFAAYDLVDDREQVVVIRLEDEDDVSQFFGGECRPRWRARGWPPTRTP